jgi:hypothetical protein
VVDVDVDVGSALAGPATPGSGLSFELEPLLEPELGDPEVPPELELLPELELAPELS